MKNIKIGFFALLIITSFASCESLFKGAVLEVELPEHESQLAPYAFFRDTDTILTVKVGKSVGVLDTINPDIVYNANVELYKNGVLAYTFTYSDSVQAYQVALGQPFNPTVGEEYELRVSAAGFDATSAKQIVPERVEVIEASIDIAAGTNAFGDQMDIVKIKFRDPAGVKNYYEVSGYQQVKYFSSIDSTITDEYENSYYFESNDPNFSNGTIADLSFDGREYLLRLEKYNWFGTTSSNVEIKESLNFNSTTLEYVTFVNSLEEYWLGEDNPFAEPVLLYSNMSKGLGAFGILRTIRVDF